MRQVKCTVGNKLCGKRCIKKEWKCREEEQQQPKSRGTGKKIAIGLAIVLSAGIGAYFAFRAFKIKEAELNPSPEQIRKKLERERPSDTLSYFNIDENEPPPVDALKAYSNTLKTYAEGNPSPDDVAFVEEINKASKLYSIKDLESEFDIEIDPGVRSKFDENESLILIIDNDSPIWQQIRQASGVTAEAMYHPYLRKVLVPDTFTNLSKEMQIMGNTPSSVVSHELVHLNQFRGNWHYTDEEYIEKIKNLTPLEFSALKSVNEMYTLPWSQMIFQYMSLGLHVSRATLQRAEFEAYLATTRWDKIENILLQK